MPKLTPLEDALAIVLDCAPAMPVEEIDVMDALGRVVARDLVSDIDINGFADAAMDGFAIKGDDIAAASEEAPVSLKIVDVVGAGHLYNGVLQSGEAVRIMTGAAMPEGSDTNVKIEVTEVTGDGLTGENVLFRAPVKVGTNVRQPGEEALAGQTVFTAGSVVNAAGIGLLASTGNVRVPVFARPKVGIISIGTELVDSSTVPPMGMKRDSNRYTLAAMAKEAGADVTMYPIVADEPEAIAEAYRKAAAENDCVVSSGGACGGDFDYVSQIIDSLGEVRFEYVNLRPGKAQTFGVAPDGTLMFGLSGNPAACATGFEVLVRPALRKAQGFTQLARPVVRATLTESVRTKDTRRYMMRGTVEALPEGGYRVTPLKKQSSAVIGSTSRANCFIVLREGCSPFDEGTEVECLRVDLPEGAPIVG